MSHSTGLTLTELTEVYNRQQDDGAMQREAAKLLRKYAIDYLREGDGPTAVGFRGAIKHEDLNADYKNFLTKQARDGIWATYIEACALAEFLNVNLVVTVVNEKGEKNMMALHRAESNRAPTIHLCNFNNGHWDYQGKAIDDGNCLYNAFALAHRDLVQPVEANTINITKSKDECMQEQMAVTLQKALLAKFPKPAERLSSIQKEQERIAKLSHKEQRQIEKDRRYALKLAFAEVQQAKEKKVKIVEPMANDSSEPDYSISLQP